jgi:DNA recombination protein RmuC
VLVTARQFPGVDAAALASVPASTASTGRRFTAPELITSDARTDGQADEPPIEAEEVTDPHGAETVRADVGEVRIRLDGM